MDISEAVVQQQLYAVPLQDFYAVLDYSLMLEADHPLEVLQHLCNHGLRLYSSKPDKGSTSAAAINMPTVIEALRSANEASLSSDLDAGEFTGAIVSANKTTRKKETALLFDNAWVKREEVRKAFQAIAAGRFPWPKVHWPSTSSDWCWYPTNSLSDPEAMPLDTKTRIPTSASERQPRSNIENSILQNGDYWTRL